MEGEGGGGREEEDWYFYFTVSWIRVSRPPASVPRFTFKVKTGQKAGKHQIDRLILGEGGKGGGEREGGEGEGGKGTLLGRLAKEKS